MRAASNHSPIGEKALGRHLTLEYLECDHRVLNQPATLEDLFTKTAERAGATVLRSDFRRFEPQGASGFLIIAESHFSVHTWPEHGFAAVDIFTCGDSINFHVAQTLLKRGLGAARLIVSADFHRGRVEHLSPPETTIVDVRQEERRDDLLGERTRMAADEGLTCFTFLFSFDGIDFSEKELARVVSLIDGNAAGHPMVGGAHNSSGQERHFAFARSDGRLAIAGRFKRGDGLGKACVMATEPFAMEALRSKLEDEMDACSFRTI